MSTDKPDRDRHGFRGVPPPATFSLEDLPDEALLKELEVAAVLRNAPPTLQDWRQQPDHPLEWLSLPGGFVRYTAGAVRRYIAGGAPRSKKSNAPA
jgi:hypothetical protein